VSWPPPPGGTWLIDLDGVVWLAGQPIAGSGPAIDALHRAGVRTLFVTNNAGLTLDQMVERLARAGVTAHRDDLVTSAQAAATLLAPGARVLAVGQGGALEALAERGATVTEEPPFDAVVVGYTRAFDYDRLTAACRALRSGARLIGTNDDATYPTPDGLVPGAGSLLAAVATAGGVIPEVAGKPNQAMADLVRQRAPDVTVMVGDRPSTDGRFAEVLGTRFALVYSGVTRPDQTVDTPRPAATAADLGALVRAL